MGGAHRLVQLRDGAAERRVCRVEEPLLRTVLQHTGGNQTQAAALLGISRSTLRKKLAHYDID